MNKSKGVDSITVEVGRSTKPVLKTQRKLTKKRGKNVTRVGKKVRLRQTIWKFI